MSILSAQFKLTRSAVLKPRFNIAPGNVIPVIRKPGDLEFLNWGLKPVWLKDEQNAFTNARMETLDSKPAFRQAFKKQRCLIIADGYYEWRAIGKIKQPYYIRLPDHGLFAFAGLWDGDSCLIITKPADQANLIQIHERMPVIISTDNYATWLDPKSSQETLQNCMLNPSLKSLQIFPVTTKMNNPKYDVAECILSLQ